MAGVDECQRIICLHAEYFKRANEEVREEAQKFAKAVLALKQGMPGRVELLVEVPKEEPDPLLDRHSDFNDLPRLGDCLCDTPCETHHESPSLSFADSEDSRAVGTAPAEAHDEEVSETDTVRDAPSPVGSLSQDVTSEPVRPADGRYRCAWALKFGGSCRLVLAGEQAHDRHVAGHLPDDDGYEVKNFECSICHRKFPRRDSCTRHFPKKHAGAATAYCIDLPRHWWWPAKLFYSNEYRGGTRLPRPPGEVRSWDQRIRDVISMDPILVNRPYQDRSPDIGLATNEDAPPPAKRRRTA
ncbi:hypothetical protein A7U60_g7523 [Sanghuangporus baumii]|uniref:C2H2-type domain-containing protein n=1 Tax=Sanghuangporus baumii TaxID=108892 RepID=A0A9Q5HT53_SANBA|nr:hypothetical protein A7U60_g7523 [Sanghuangporus baumii]